MKNDEFHPFWFVWTAPKRGFPGSYRPVRKTFSTREKAEEVAIQMSQRNKGKKFFVAEAIKRVEVSDDAATIIDGSGNSISLGKA